MEDSSAYRAVSLGVVVVDKDFDSDIVIVSPLEVLSIQNTGVIAPKGTGVEYRSDKDSITQDVFTSEHTSTSTVEAKWKPIGITNRKTAPDMVANELVMLYKYGDEDEYYWSEYNDTRELKKLERVITRFSNLSAGGSPGTILTDDNSYSVTVSTKDKYLRIHVPNNDGEATTWDIDINTATGVLSILDGEGNKLNWNAVSGELEETFNTKITRTAPTIIDNCTTHIVNSSTSEHNTSSYTKNTNSTTTNANVAVTNASSTTTNSSSTTINTASLGISAGSGSMSMSGDSAAMSVTNMTMNTNLTTNGTLTNNGKNVGSTHRHPSGVPYTGTPE